VQNLVASELREPQCAQIFAPNDIEAPQPVQYLNSFKFGMPHSVQKRDTLPAGGGGGGLGSGFVSATGTDFETAL
jgi:hypothetical protein